MKLNKPKSHYNKLMEDPETTKLMKREVCILNFQKLMYGVITQEEDGMLMR